MDQLMDGHVVMVTGAAGGIGRAIIERLEAVGAEVVAVARSKSDLSPGSPNTVVAMDLRDPDAPARAVDAAVNTHGRIDGLVNCAGIQPVVDFVSMTDSQWSEVIDIDLTATHRLTQAVARSMIDAERRGSIVHITSIEGTRPASGHSHYSVAKAGLIMHAKAAALELGPRGVRVNSVSPGLIERPDLAADWPEGVATWNAHAPLGRLGTGHDVANACLFLLSDMSRWITGTDLVVDGGMSVVQPW